MPPAAQLEIITGISACIFDPIVALLAQAKWRQSRKSSALTSANFQRQYRIKDAYIHFNATFETIKTAHFPQYQLSSNYLSSNYFGEGVTGKDLHL